jgi:prepilin peptidase CpaA
MFPLPFLFLTVVLLFASANDLLFHKIPNWLTYSTMIGGVVYYFHLKDLDGLLFSMGGISLGMAVLIIPFLMGGMEA